MIGKALRVIRKGQGYSLSQTASELSIAVSYLSEIENGHKQPSLEIVEQYASLFGIPVSHIMIFSEEMDEGFFSAKAKRFVCKPVLALMDKYC